MLLREKKIDDVDSSLFEIQDDQLLSQVKIDFTFVRCAVIAA